VDKQLISFQNLFGFLRDFSRESVMRRFVISNFSASRVQRVWARSIYQWFQIHYAWNDMGRWTWM